jgi:hypothetical protein
MHAQRHKISIAVSSIQCQNDMTIAVPHQQNAVRSKVRAKLTAAIETRQQRTGFAVPMYLLLQTGRASISVPYDEQVRDGSKSAMPIPSLPANSHADLNMGKSGELQSLRLGM